MSSPAAIVFASFSPHPDKVEEMRATLDTMVAATRDEPGCEFYDLYESDEGTRFHLFERYIDADALEAHRASDHYKAYRAKLSDLLSEPVAVTVLGEVDVN
ncbi:MAG: antibiotic biosynthesis monooxygenase [Acidimicrobiia bacterium]|nr:antibiotic biosynthesis monooxygenase [Acidimicrobiia bacterium]